MKIKINELKKIKDEKETFERIISTAHNCKIGENDGAHSNTWCDGERIK